MGFRFLTISREQMEGLKRRNGTDVDDVKEFCIRCMADPCMCIVEPVPEEVDEPEVQPLPKICRFDDTELNRWAEEDRNYDFTEHITVTWYRGYWDEKSLDENDQQNDIDHWF